MFLTSRIGKLLALRLAVCGSLLPGAVSIASAQTDQRFGLVIGYPAGVQSTTTTEFRHSTTSVGMSGLVTVSRREPLRLYLAPRISWNRIHSSSASDAAELVLPIGGISNLLPIGSRSDVGIVIRF